MSHIDLFDVVAHIKPEYVVAVESQPEPPKSTSGAANTSEPPTKKQKLTGTHKHRPKYQRVPKAAKLCRAVWCVGPGQDPRALCSYPSCDFMHDVAAYLATKLPDIGKECHNFRTFGRCQYGVVCRYGEGHIKDGGNLVDEAVLAERQGRTIVSNTLSKELQISLRKRQYDFSSAQSCHQRATKLREEATNQAERQTNVSSNHTQGQTTTNETSGSWTNQKQGHVKTEEKSEQEVVKESNAGIIKETVDKAKENVDLIKENVDKAKENIDKAKENVDIAKEIVDLIKENVDLIKENVDKAKENVDKATEEGKDVREGKSKDVDVKKDAERNSDVVEVKKDVREDTVEEGKMEENGEIIPDNKREGPTSDQDLVKLLSREKKKISWHGKSYLAPLTTLGNLPFRRVCKRFGADITCGEMAMANCLLQGAPSEWALVKRHPCEDIFGIQVCGSSPEVMTKAAQLLEENVDFDFLDINMGCPIDLVYKQGGGSALMRRGRCLEVMVRGMTQATSRPLTLKMRTAIYSNTRVAHTIIQKAKLWDVNMVTVHGRSREQRYLKLADWDYIRQCVEVADPIPVFGNGDILSYEDHDSFVQRSGVAGVMVGRGALVKPWVFQEMKEHRHLDISASERLDMLRLYVNYGLEHWGSDTEGVEKTRRFMLEWLSFLHRYVPTGLLETTQRLNQRPPVYHGRSDLETLMASRAASDWVKISEMLLGPTPSDFHFLPKHKASAY